ncbi:MAG: peptide chain release factor N(5)-glutamine methyltransferase [Prevotellaceae bacterium]|nr:peptide chain release factor N(5)-glutamine methyltransferase [Prevotellaceae bacterium]
MTPLSSFRQQLLALYPDGEARAITRLVAEEKFHLGVTDLLLGKDSEMSEADKAEARNILTRLLKGEPVQYVLGTATFLGRRFTVGQGCLIPRPETEDLLSQTLGYLDEDKGELSFLDIGTGSGCIAISIALRSPRFKVTAWDISEEALQYARQNAINHATGVQFECRDMLHPALDERQWNVIVSNPPYVLQSEAEGMERNVLDFEPHIALFVPDDDPLLFHRAIAEFALGHLRQGGSIHLEVNERLAGECEALALGLGYSKVTLNEDRNGKPRCLHAWL